MNENSCFKLEILVAVVKVGDEEENNLDNNNKSRNTNTEIEDTFEITHKIN